MNKRFQRCDSERLHGGQCTEADRHLHFNIQVSLEAQITGDSQVLPDSSQFSLRVGQLNCKVLLVFIRKRVGWVW